MGLDGKGLNVRGVVDAGMMNYMYINEQKLTKKAEEGDEKAKEDLAKEKKLRAEAKEAGAKMAKEIGEIEGNGFVVLMGALHNDWHVTFGEGLKDALPKGTVVVGGVGQWRDYVYADGASQKPETGRLAIVIEGTGFEIDAFGSVCEDKYKKEKVEVQDTEVIKKATDELSSGKADAVISFSCVTRLRESKLMDPSIITNRLAEAAGEQAALFGNFCGGEIYLGKDGEYVAGGDRLVAVGIKSK